MRLLLWLVALTSWLLASAQELQPVRVGLLQIVDALPVFVARDQGLFQQAGLAPDIITFASAAERNDAIVAGELDFWIGDVVSMALLRKAAPVRIAFLALGATPQEGRFAILVPPNSPLQALADLHGHPVAISQNSVIEFVLDQLLAGTGISVQKQVVDNIAQRFQLLVDGQVDAAVLPDPLLSLAVTLGARILQDDTAENISQSVWGIREGAENLLPALQQAYNQAVDLINADPQGFIPVLARDARLPPQIQTSFVVVPYPRVQLPTPAQVERVINWLVSDKGLLAPGEVTYEGLVVPGAVPAMEGY
ncbi:MAG: ABC transporter substrate-binding protein [Deinococcus sp.]|nr:ABC transporter substrate-binding protein [Deinococcus sp.]